MTHTIPEGMTAVSKHEFFQFLRDRPEDIMPRLQDPYFTSWETHDSRVFGWSFPGWKNPGDAPEIWAIRLPVTSLKENQ